MSDVQQGPRETVEQRLQRVPNVLESYARFIEKYGSVPDSALPELLQFTAAQLRATIERDQETASEDRSETSYEAQIGKLRAQLRTASATIERLTAALKKISACRPAACFATSIEMCDIADAAFSPETKA